MPGLRFFFWWRGCVGFLFEAWCTCTVRVFQVGAMCECFCVWFVWKPRVLLTWNLHVLCYVEGVEALWIRAGLRCVSICTFRTRKASKLRPDKDKNNMVYYWYNKIWWEYRRYYPKLLQMTSITFCLLTLVYISNLSPPLHWTQLSSLPWVPSQATLSTINYQLVISYRLLIRILTNQPTVELGNL
jgi:hypothetical protein